MKTRYATSGCNHFFLTNQNKDLTSRHNYLTSGNNKMSTYNLFSFSPSLNHMLDKVCHLLIMLTCELFMSTCNKIMSTYNIMACLACKHKSLYFCSKRYQKFKISFIEKKIINNLWKRAYVFIWHEYYKYRSWKSLFCQGRGG